MKLGARYVAPWLFLCMPFFASARYPERSITLVVPAPAGTNLDGAGKGGLWQLQSAAIAFSFAAVRLHGSANSRNAFGMERYVGQIPVWRSRHGYSSRST